MDLICTLVVRYQGGGGLGTAVHAGVLRVPRTPAVCVGLVLRAALDVTAVVLRHLCEEAP